MTTVPGRLATLEEYEAAKTLIKSAAKKLAEEHHPETPGAIYEALLFAWMQLVTDALCPGCARNILAAARAEIYEALNRITAAHTH